MDDDPEIRRLLGDYLRTHGFAVETAGNGREMRAALERGRVDLVVLDLMLPGEDGLTLCRNLRARSRLPVIMLTALGEEADRIVGLEMGADDYLVKPFNPRELLARIRGVLRRTHSLPPSPEDEFSEFHFAGWRLDVTGRQLVSPHDVVVPLSSGEFRLLLAFVTHPHHVLSRDQLLDITRGREPGPFDRSIDVQVGRLRRKLDDEGRDNQLIKTVRGEGYVLAVEVERRP